ncbi:MAG: hypothetical protein MI919_09555 [Holophagales bacterium]|nr:hypothetical protein [Holophagales bacterium]
MRVTNRSWIILAFFALGALPSAMPGSACGGGVYEVRFWNEDQPDDPEAFLGGDLVPVGPRLSFPFLYVTYRHLVGLPVPEGMIEAVLLSSPSRAGPDAARQWQEARWRWTGDPAGGVSIRRIRFVQTAEGDHLRMRSIWNCLDDAFATAIRTLEARRLRFGRDSPELREWLRGQDTVFANCGEGRHIPEEIGPEWPEVLRHDRRYQIAAAHFYAQEHAEAERRFRALGEDADSPWSEISRYLVARVLLRQDRGQEALAYLEELLAGGRLELYRPAAERLLDHVRHREDPASRLAELAERLADPALLSVPALDAGPDGTRDPRERFRQDLIDLHYALGSGPPPNDLAAWLAQLHPGTEGSVESALARLESGAGDHWWLAAALSELRSAARHSVSHPREGARAEDLRARLLRAADRIEPEARNGPGRWLYTEARLQLLALAGRLDEVEAELVAALAEVSGSSFRSTSLRNRLADLHRRLAPDLETYLERSMMRPVASGWVNGFDGTLIGLDVPALAEEDLLDATAARVLDRTSASRLLELGELPFVPAQLRRRLALVAFTRAVALGDDSILSRAARMVAELEPALAAEMAAIDGAAEEGERRFLARLAILRAPGLHPDVHPHVGRREPVRELHELGQNWWCAGSSFDLGGRALPVSQRLAETLTADPTWVALERLPSAPLALGPEILAWADANPRDPRVPEALHRLVVTTRRTCPFGVREPYGGVSRSAFVRLHRRYPHSPWTEKTPYWFD